MRPTDFNILLYDAGVHTLIDSVASPLVALQDVDALAALTGYLTVYLAQSGSLAIVTNEEALLVFIRHAQLVGAIGVEFLDASFPVSAHSQVPSSPPVAPADLFLTAAGSGVVDASSGVGGGSAAQYELQHYDAGAWVMVAVGVEREDFSGVDYQATSITAGMQQFRVVARNIGNFPGFPGTAESLDVT